MRALLPTIAPRAAALLLAAAALPSPARAQATSPYGNAGGATAPIVTTADRFHPVTGRLGMVASQEIEATRAGLAVLDEGGNAVDAAVTTALALAVTLPRAGNLGGGGFIVLHDAATGSSRALDFRERAPAAAHRDLFLGADGEVDNALARDSYRSSGVPGSVAGLAAALREHGTITWERALRPAIALAEEGFVVSDDLHDSLVAARPRLARSPITRAVFYPEDGAPPRVGSVFRQPMLARTLRRLASEGPEEFYNGETAAQLVSAMKTNDGLVTFDDLAAYAPAWREPVRGRFRGLEIVSMPPPSSGGIHLVQLLQMVEGDDLEGMGLNSAAYVRLLAEAMKSAYADRAQFIGDPDHVRVPALGLVDPAYVAARRAAIPATGIRPGPSVAPGDPWAFEPGGKPEGAGPAQPSSRESNETTHLSVIDADGNAVALTTTINFSYGNGHVVPGAGFLLNNEMDDFVSKPGVPNGFGLLGGDANAIAPGKRMVSSMTPTLVLEDGSVRVATGSPGGSLIITTVFQNLLNLLVFGLNPAEAAAQPRFHHQGSPDVLRVERGFSADTLRLLEAEGWRVEQSTAMGSTQTIVRTKDGRLLGASDPRRPGAGTLGLQP